MSTCKEYINIDVIYTVVSQGPSNVYVHVCTHTNTVLEIFNVIISKCG